jgi:phage terminase large subunit-like protein
MLHLGQREADKRRTRFFAVRCGRRWGKTAYAKVIAEHAICSGQNVGIFAPDYKILAETFNELAYDLSPLKVASSKIEGVFRAATGGRVDFWSLDNERAGRSRKYHLVIIDEAAFAKQNMMDIWEKAIKPSLLDYVGGALVLSTPNGSDPDNFFYQICTDKKYGFTEYHAPTHTNPFLPRSEIDKLEHENAPLVFRQEYLAEFVDWSGSSFFSLDSLLLNKEPIKELDWRIDQVFATVDTASKDGAQHDGTGVIFWGRSKHHGIPLLILDWDVTQIEASLLSTWLPGVIQRCEDLAAQFKAREGSLGVWIEDKDSGIALLQTGKRLRMPVHAIDSKLTAQGKEGKAIVASPHVYQGSVKFTQFAFDKTKIYRKQSKNHLLDQVGGFCMGMKRKEHKLDLVDCFSYGVCISLGNAKGW